MITEDYACEKAQLVTRRAGPDIACSLEEASASCKQIYEQFKLVGLPAFDAQDDLLKTPASIYNKIQYGGLLALNSLITEGSAAHEKKVENIFDLIQQSEKKFKNLNAIPFDQFIDTMKAFKIKRKKSKR